MILTGASLKRCSQPLFQLYNIPFCTMNLVSSFIGEFAGPVLGPCWVRYPVWCLEFWKIYFFRNSKRWYLFRRCKQTKCLFFKKYVSSKTHPCPQCLDRLSFLYFISTAKWNKKGKYPNGIQIFTFLHEQMNDLKDLFNMKDV